MLSLISTTKLRINYDISFRGLHQKKYIRNPQFNFETAFQFLVIPAEHRNKIMGGFET